MNGALEDAGAAPRAGVAASAAMVAQLAEGDARVTALLDALAQGFETLRWRGAPVEKAPRSVIASEAKQSRDRRAPYDPWIAASLSLLAMTVLHDRNIV